VGKFINDHPWMTFFLGLAALDSIAYIVGGPPKLYLTPPPTAGGTTSPTGQPQLGAGHMVGTKVLPWLNPAAYSRPRAVG
jgi:hypothetical protein